MSKNAVKLFTTEAMVDDFAEKFVGGDEYLLNWVIEQCLPTIGTANTVRYMEEWGVHC